jgi:hypothetical protein
LKIIFRKTPTALLLLALSTTTAANGIDFSLGGGYPFIAVPEVSMANADQTQRWHFNYKIGLDDGFTIGFEQALSADKKHAMGLIVGALGVNEDEDRCADTESDLSCLVSKIFLLDEETTNGVGLSYGYYFSGLNNVGWNVKFEVGYGEGSESHQKRSDASIRIAYQF